MSHPQCCANAPVLDENCGVGKHGKFENVHGLDMYITGSPESKRGILLIADVFGYKAPNLRNLADQIGDAGYLVVVPDFLHGDPFDKDKYTWDEWNKKHPMDQMIVEAKSVIDNLKTMGMVKIGCASFCWAAQVTVGLTTPDYIQAAVLFHPAFITNTDILGIKVPISILGAEDDKVTPKYVVKIYEKILDVKSVIPSLDPVDYFVKIFLGVAHGFAIRYDPNDKEAAKKAEEAHKAMLDWFSAHLVVED